MKIILACAAVLVLATGCTGPSYDDRVIACQQALKEHDFDAAPLSEGERLPGCEELKEEDYDTLNLNAAMDRLGWLDENGKFDEDRLHEDVTAP